MQPTTVIYVLGTAGCGKSTFTAAAARWLDSNDYSVQTVNLDPGADALPYEPEVDVRDWVTLADIMEEYGLGPNGAQVVAADMIALHRSRMIDELAVDEAQFIIVDTPGQLELFAFRESAKEIINGILPKSSVLVYLIDPFNARTPSGYISQVMLANLCKLRFQVPTIELISKSDMMGQEMREVLTRWQEYPDHLGDDVMREASERPTMETELSIGLYRTMEDLGLFGAREMVSAGDERGFERLYQTIQLVYGGGEDRERSA
ncbi:MAG: ATP/GTP-binding protein [Candidatus Thermoplasmatota archaeon]|nr:ATP/GTP-binding protein [Candidatus Thermoplasmatota archaeon]